MAQLEITGLPLRTMVGGPMRTVMVHDGQGRERLEITIASPGVQATIILTPEETEQILQLGRSRLAGKALGSVFR